MVVTLGVRGTKGGPLLEANAELKRYLFDVTELRDGLGGGWPNGTDSSTQERVRNTPGFAELFQKALGKILTQSLVIIVCKHCHHRSVAMAEMAAQRLRDLHSSALTLDVIHVDLDEITSDQRRRLLQWS